MLCDGRGIPLALAIHPSKQHDSTTIDELLDGLCPPEIPKNSSIYLDKGYDSEHIRCAFELMDINAKIPRRFPRPGRPYNLGKNRWQVERSFSWLNRFGRVKCRMEKKVENYMAILQLSSAWITLRMVLG